MRLFYAILLSEEMKQALVGAQDFLRAQGIQGNYTRRENLHLTLAFLGETDRLSAARRAAEQLGEEPFRLSLKGVGSFRRGDSELFWAGVNLTSELKRLQSVLSGCLREEGFSLENRRFQPHLTLAREVRVPAPFDREAFSSSVSPTEMEVRAVSLMKSERIRGVLTYTEIFRGSLISKK